MDSPIRGSNNPVTAALILLIGPAAFDDLSSVEYAMDMNSRVWMLKEKSASVEAALVAVHGEGGNVWVRMMRPNEDDYDVDLTDKDLVGAILNRRHLNGMCLEQDIYFLPTGLCYVNVYHTQREYGGPEEGGWYYDADFVKAMIPCAQDRAEEIRALMVDIFRYLDDDRALSSVLSEGKLRVKIEDAPGTDTPRPHYE